MTIAIEPLPDETGIELRDRIEQRRCRIVTDEPVEAAAGDPDGFPYPLDAAVDITASRLTVGNVPTGYVRNSDGELIREVEHFSGFSLSSGTYLFEMSAPVKLYLDVQGPVDVSVDGIQMSLAFDGATQVSIGVRSYHERPATTITTTPEPDDLMTAVSSLSSALKTTGPDRAYPTLRGHPPELAVGSELQVPEMLDPPDTGIAIEIPPELRAVFVVAPLAYYLGAEVRRGDAPRIVTGEGFVHPLTGGREFEDEVERVLKQTFLLDSAIRSEGAYVIPTREERVVDGRLSVGPSTLYDLDPGPQLAEYLSVPYDAVSDLVPRWKLTAHVTPRADSIEVLPFLVDDLAVIRTPRPFDLGGGDPYKAAIDEFVRTDGEVRGDGGVQRRGDPWGDDDHATRSDLPLVEPEQADSIEQAWVGDDVPVGASKAVAQAYRNRLDRTPQSGDIGIVVVCNDAEMADERQLASEVYGSRDELPFDVTLYEDLTADRLALVLESDIDFFHYIGHIEHEGFRCSDGVLDVASVDGVGLDTFFLNACRSYRQGMALIENGAIGGVVTLDDVINSGAVRVGKAMCRLLNRGFPLRAALTIASERSVVGPQYIVVGDGNMDLIQGESVVPNLVEVDRTDHGFDVAISSYPTQHFGLGGVFKPEIGGNTDHFLTASRLMEFEVTERELSDFLDLAVVPVRARNQLFWSDRVGVDDL
ncbi:hypothetical protein [Halorarius halobius]|uniref:hypothetical protein n=1 Tax=Halorarius halobius TaxID=2962671 RepID=UPI0020CBBC0D|nr:hypothetical protein [Halorarius halobius]